jgi:hypothetical protein
VAGVLEGGGDAVGLEVESVARDAAAMWVTADFNAFA